MNLKNNNIMVMMMLMMVIMNKMMRILHYVAIDKMMICDKQIEIFVSLLTINIHKW